MNTEYDKNDVVWVLDLLRYQSDEGYLYVDNDEAAQLISILKKYIPDYEEM